MRQIDTEILVIGGGATGTGIIRDLAMRGFKAVLVERRDLAHGTTGRYHGLLHSGGRYAVKDPQAARECIEENKILRKIMPQCIEDTGGFFILTPSDDPAYAPRFVNGCEQAGIPVEEVPISKMLREESALNPEITRCFRVPDASADSFLAADLNANAARQLGATLLLYHEVNRLILQSGAEGPNTKNGRVTGALCHDLISGEEVVIHADLVVNASGAWAGKIASTAGIAIQIRPGKGIMLAVNHRIVNTVINRCKMPADGDILVPAHTVAVIGTTDVQVSDPDRFTIEPWEINLMLNEGEKMIPGFRNLRILRAWGGVRPLYQEESTEESRDITRAYVLLDHALRDGIEGLVTITSGKWTTYRKMAEATVDKVCEKLHTFRPCRTHLEPLPSPEPHYHTLGARLSQVEKEKKFRDVICECELATYQEVENAILLGNAQTIDDIRRDTRLGMGPCQGGFCTLRAAGILHRLRKLPVNQTNTSLRDFLQERWKGLQPILWGGQLRQERLDELVYLDVLNADHLPGEAESHLKAEPYSLSSTHSQPAKIGSSHPIHPIHPPQTPETSSLVDVLVIGAGLAGLAAAWRASQAGKRVRLIAKGWGAQYWGAGSIDVLGYLPPATKVITHELRENVAAIIKANPHHPYAITGIEGVETALVRFQELCADAAYPLRGSLDQNWLLPTALGSLRPTCLAPETMLAGEVKNCQPAVIVGFERYYDFFPEMIAANLDAQGFSAQAIRLDLPSLRERKTLTTRILAQYFESPEFRHELIQALKSNLQKGTQSGKETRLGFPAVLGLKNSLRIWNELQEQLGCAVFEIPGLPPSIPGMRLHQILCQAIQKTGGVIYEGMQAVRTSFKDRKIQSVWSEAAARLKPHQAHQFVLASGGILGGGIVVGSEGAISETLFDLAVQHPTDQSTWLLNKFFTENGHPLFRSGIAVDADFHPLNERYEVPFENLSVIGSLLASSDPIFERSLEGIALATGYTVGQRLGELPS